MNYELKNIKISNLNKNNLYLLNVEYLAPKDFFSKAVRFVTKFVWRKKHSRIIVGHTGLILYNNEKWLLLEIGYNGKQHGALSFNPNKNYYTRSMGSITQEEKEELVARFSKKPVTNFFLKIIFTFSSVILSFPYPFFGALASIEFGKSLGIVGYIADYILDLIRDIQFFVIKSILKIEIPSFCLNASFKECRRINEERIDKGRKTLLSMKPIYDIIDVENNIFYELYPQQVFEFIPHKHLIS